MNAKCKFLIAALASAGISQSALAWDNLYLIGGGTPAGWSLDNAIEMKKDGSIYSVVCYLSNADGDGRSFRIQASRDWDGNYYGGATHAQRLENDVEYIAGEAYGQNNENAFSVPAPGFYLITLDESRNAIKINLMGHIGVTGDLKDHSWQPDGGTDTYLYNENGGSLYTGIITVTQGDFKFNVDPGSANPWAQYHYLFREDKYRFFTQANQGDQNDLKWSVGFPDQDTHAERDLDPGKYRMRLDAADRSVRFTRLAEDVILDGPGVLKDAWDGDNSTLHFSQDGDQMVCHNVFFKANAIFKPRIDGYYYGSDQWRATTISGAGNAYLRQVAIGADLAVDASGFRDVYVRPSGAGDGTLDIYVTEPHAVWYEGMCGLDANDSGYANQNLNWTDGGNIEVKVNGNTVHTFTGCTPGWYTASITFDYTTPQYHLDKQLPRLAGDVSGDTGFADTDYSGSGKYLKHRVWLEGGRTVHAEIGSARGADVSVPGSGFYDAVVYMADGRPVLELRGPVNVMMPLSAADFDNGRRHYFLVGQRMGAWRLQPEWEFTEAGDGTYTIPARLLYNGYIMVGMVDNYEDYISQVYHGYSASDTGARTVLDPRNNNTDKNVSFTLAALAATGSNGYPDGKFTGTRYNDIERTAPAAQHGGYEAMAMRLINVLDPEGFGDQEHLQSAPSRVSTIRLHVDGDGHPSYLDFEGVNTAPLEVARIRTFSLCGGGIKNHNVTYDEATATTPLNHQPGYGGDGWCEAWIQYDSKGRPYVDAHGEYIYQTSFTLNWLRRHPSYFNFDEGFNYTSNNITFAYNEQITHPDQFGQRWEDVEGSSRREYLFTYCAPTEFPGRNTIVENNLDAVMNVPAANRACFVVEDMWMEGLFKVWSGWNGAATNYEYEDNGTTYTRWFRDNAGHGAYQDKRTAYFKADEILAYSLFEDIDAADFGIGYGLPGGQKVEANGSIKPEYYEHPERRFFKRVEIWYNLDNNFVFTGNTASFLVFYQEKGGPNITIGKKDEQTIHYSFHIPLINGYPEEADTRIYGDVTYYRIERIPIYDDGSEGTPELVEERHDVNQSRPDFFYTEIADPATLSPGRYRYQITTKRRGSGDEEFSAKSNIVRLDGQTGPSTGITDIAADSDFDFTVAPNPVTDVLNVRANTTIGRLTVCAVNGAVVRSLNVSANSCSIDVSGLPAGIYLVTANNNTQRIIKR